MNILTLQDTYNQKDATLYGSKNVKDSTALLYHENSKFTEHSARQQGERIGGFSSPYITDRSSQPYKVYPGSPTIDLNEFTEFNDPNDPFLSLLNHRRSVRTYQENYAISLYELHTLLYHTYGVTHKEPMMNSENYIGFRNIPSPGALYSLEIYVVLFNSHVENGLYHYRPDTNQLQQLKTGHFLNELKQIIQAEPYININSASGIVLTTGMIERLCIKYGERAYRFMLHESGFFAQTFSLIAEQLTLGSCMVGGYIDDKINNFIGIDGVFETIQNVIIFGKKP